MGQTSHPTHVQVYTLGPPAEIFLCKMYNSSKNSDGDVDIHEKVILSTGNVPRIWNQNTKDLEKVK